MKKYIFSLLMLLSTLFLFNSCEEDPYYEEDYDLTTILCAGRWTESFVTNNGEECYHELNFFTNFTGVDYYEYYRGNILIRKTEEAFRWHWDAENYYYPNSLYMDYPDGTFSYFEDIQIRGPKMRGILDEEKVIFTLQ